MSFGVGVEDARTSVTPLTDVTIAASAGKSALRAGRGAASSVQPTPRRSGKSVIGAGLEQLQMVTLYLQSDEALYRLSISPLPLTARA